MKWGDSGNVNNTALKNCMDYKRMISKCFMEGAVLFVFHCYISSRDSPNRDWVATRIRDIVKSTVSVSVSVCLSLCLCFTPKNRIIPSFNNTVTLLRSFIMPGLRRQTGGGAAMGEQPQFDSSRSTTFPLCTFLSDLGGKPTPPCALLDLKVINNCNINLLRPYFH